MPIASFKSVREVSSEDAVHVAENLLKESAGKKWRTKTGNEKSAYVVLEFQEPQQITGIDIGNEHSNFIEVLVSRTGCQTDDFRELLLSSSFMTPVESKNSSNQNRVRCFSAPALDQTALPEKWKLLKLVCTQPFNRHVQYGLSFVKVHVVAAAAPAPTPAPAKVKSLLPERIMQFGAFKLREESPDSENDSQLTRFQSWKKESQLKQQQPAATTTAAAIRDAETTALRRFSTGKVSANLPKASSNPSPVPAARRSVSSDADAAVAAKPLDRNRASLLFGEDNDEDNVEDIDEQNAKKRRLSKHLEADKDRRRQEQEKEKERKDKEKSKRHSLSKSISNENKSSAKEDKPVSKEERRSSKEDKPSARKEDKHESRSKEPTKNKDSSKARDNSRPSGQKRLSSSPSSTPAKKPRIKDPDPRIQYHPFNQLLSGVVLVISGIQNPDRADLRSKATALGAKYKADWEPGCTHLICAFKNTPKYNQVKGKGKIVTRSWIEKCYSTRKYLPWRRYALNTTDLGQPESDEELCDEARKPSSRRESKEEEGDETIKVANTYDVDPKDPKKMAQNQEASSGIDTDDELKRVADENRKKKAKPKTPVKAKSTDDIYDVSTDEEDFLAEKRKQIVVLD